MPRKLSSGARASSGFRCLRDASSVAELGIELGAVASFRPFTCMLACAMSQGWTVGQEQSEIGAAAYRWQWIGLTD